MTDVRNEYLPSKSRQISSGKFIWIDHPPKRNLAHRLIKGLSDMVYRRRVARLRRGLKSSGGL